MWKTTLNLYIFKIPYTFMSQEKRIKKAFNWMQLWILKKRRLKKSKITLEEVSFSDHDHNTARCWGSWRGRLASMCMCYPDPARCTGERERTICERWKVFRRQNFHKSLDEGGVNLPYFSTSNLHKFGRPWSVNFAKVWGFQFYSWIIKLYGSRGSVHN